MAVRKKPKPPVKFSPKVADEICGRIANGESLRSICKDAHMPTVEGVRLWLVKGEQDGADERLADFVAQYARAREDQADYYADEIIEIVDTEDDPARARVRADARKWVASKLKAKKYGDSTSVKHEGGVTVNVVTGVSREPGQLSKRGGYDDAGEDE